MRRSSRLPVRALLTLLCALTAAHGAVQPALASARAARGGAVSSADTPAFAADLTLPATTLTAPLLTTATSAKRAFTVSWAPNEAALSYRVEYKTGVNGVWTPWLVGTVARSATFNGALGATYYFRARTTDLAGNVGPWSVPKRATVPRDQSGTGAVYSAGWATKTYAPSFMGSYRMASTAGKSVTFAFTGRAINIIGAKGPARGRAAIYLDRSTRAATTISTLATTLQNRASIYSKSFTTDGPHVVKLVTAGRIDIDGFAVPDLDRTAPSLAVTLDPPDLRAQTPVTVSVTATDNLGVSSVYLWYGSQYMSLKTPMTDLGDGRYSAVIPSSTVGSAYWPIRYYVEAKDVSGLISRFPRTAPATPAQLMRVTRAPATITGAVTWTADGSPYLVDRTTVSSGASLTIQPGVVVKFLNATSYLRVSGSLIAAGTSTGKVVFTSYKDDSYAGDTNGDGSSSVPVPGAWDGVEVATNASATVDLSHAVVRYGGSGWNRATRVGAAVSVGAANALTVKDCAFAYNTHAISAGYAKALTVSASTFTTNTDGCVSVVEPPSTTSFSGNTFSGPKDPGVYFGGTMKGTLDLPAEGVYTISHLTVPANMRLNVAAGAVVKFLHSGEPDGIAVNAAGTLDVLGTEARRVRFTSYADDSAGGDTNGDKTATRPQPGDWDGIYTGGGGALTRLAYTDLSYGGEGDHDAPAVIAMAGHGAIDVSHAVIATNVVGVDAPYTDCVWIRDSVFRGNRDGCVRITEPPANLNLSGNAFSGAKDPGVQLRGFTQSSAYLPAEGVYTIPGVLTVPAGKTLAFAPGSTVKFSGTTARIDVAGELQAQSGGPKITFTSYKDDSVGGDTNGDGGTTTPTAGDWQSIQTKTSATTRLDHAAVRYGGSLANVGAVHGSSDSTLSVKGCEFRYNVRALQADSPRSLGIEGSTFAANREGAVWLSNPPAGTTLSGNSFSGAQFAGVSLSGGIEGDLTLPDEGVYAVKALTVPVGKTLTVKPGATLKFMPLEQIRVAGTLLAEGVNDAAGRIRFTSIKDDADGDTNGNGAANAPAVFDWKTIRIDPTGSMRMRNAMVAYGGTMDLSQGAIDNAGRFDLEWCDLGSNLPGITSIAGWPPESTRARLCYWGSPNGPVYPGNPGGVSVPYHYAGGKLFVDVDVADYRVGPLSDRERALADINTLASATVPGKWTKFTRADLVTDLRKTVGDPVGQVKQGGENLCGPAAIAYQLALRDPVSYVRQVRSCYEYGRIQGRTRVYQNDNAGLYAQVPTSTCTPADWIFMAVLRNAQNAVMDYNTGDDISAITHWDEMGQWATDILWFASATWNQASLNPFFGWFNSYKTTGAALDAADRNYRAGGVSFLMVCSKSVEHPETFPVGGYPDHWVVYQGNLSRSGSATSLRVWTWGYHYDLAFSDGPKTESFMWGVERGGTVLGVNGE